MSPRLVVASRNAHKIEEIRALLAGVDIEVSGAADHDCPEVAEDAPTLEGNAEKKARAVAASTGLPSLADDTGLEVDALQGAPGVYSARYAGPDCSFADNNRKLLQALRTVPPPARTACFRSVVALAIPDPSVAGTDFETRARACRVTLHEGRLEGRIIDVPRGRLGFGYDPIFLVPELGRTLAELTLEEKNATSHRGRALRAAHAALLALGRA